MPLLIFLVIYFYFMRKLKTSNVVNQWFLIHTINIY
jgi:hypothetical protein